jgi:hypothetical protein
MELSDGVWPDRLPAVELDNPWWRENGALAFADPDHWRIVLMPKPIPLA